MGIFAPTYAHITIFAGHNKHMKSRLLVREELRDYFNGKLSTDEAVSYECALEQNARFMVDNHPLSLKVLQEWGEGYTLFEISMRNQLHLGVARDILKFCFELLGRRLQVDDGSVLNSIPPQLRPMAKNVFHAYYDTFTELPEKEVDMI
jgi:hypothetical protein